MSAEYTSIGTLHFKVIQAKLLRSTEVFGEMDPFIQVDYREHKYKTSTIQEGGKCPVWNEVLQIPILGHGDDLKITCFDEDMIVDDLVGSAFFKASLFT